MILKMGDRIRELRREMALTQEEVAQRLNVSAQAVSKWENSASYPDMELIPPLAELLGVPIDSLFRDDGETEAGELCRRADEILLAEPERARECLPSLREGAIRHPFHAGILSRLGMALRISYTIPENIEEIRNAGHSENAVPARRDPGLIKESIAAYERALNCSKDPDERGSVVRALTAVYSLAGERDKAIALANQQPKLAFSRELLLTEAEEGEEKEAAVAGALLALLGQTAVTVILAVPGPGGDVDDSERKIHAVRCVDTARLIESFFTDGKCGRLHLVLSQLYHYPAAFYAASGDYAAADECVAAIARHEQANRSYEEGGVYTYTGTLFGKLKDTDRKYIKLVSTKQYLFSEEYKAHLKGIPELAAFLDR